MINFITMGDSNYFQTIYYSVKQVKNFYPHSTYFIYDLGFLQKEKDMLNKTGIVKIIPWKIDREKVLQSSFGKTWRYYVRKLIFRRRADHLQNIRMREYLFCQKVYCILDCNKRSKDPLIYLDGDAFLINPIPEIISDTFDVGVTLRRMHELHKGGLFRTCSILNAGVIFFMGSKAKRLAFIKSWIKEMNNTSQDLFEQTALTNLVMRTRKDIFSEYNCTGKLTSGGQEITIKVLSCEIYNFNWVEEKFDKNNVKILHLKSGRFTKYEPSNLRKSRDLHNSTHANKEQRKNV